MALGTICPHFAGPDKSPLSSSFDRYLAYIADQSSIGSALSAVDVQSAIKGKWCPNVSAPKISGFQVLRQRNAALRSGLAAPVVSAWDGDLVRYGELITEARARYVALLAPIAQAAASDLLNLELSLSYRTGWARELTLLEALSRSWRQDQESLATQVGPQRAELVIRVGGLAAKDRISRGQQKLLAAVLLLSQMRLLPQELGARPTLLLDDPAAELDAQRLGGLIRAVQAQPLQLIVTTLHAELAEFAEFGTPGRGYRMEQGEVRPE